jgi:hypothetical protein
MLRDMKSRWRGNLQRSPGEELFVECPCPDGKVLIGAEPKFNGCRPEMQQITLKSSHPISIPGERQRWGAVWTNATSETHPQVLVFTVYAICVDGGQE